MLNTYQKGRIATAWLIAELTEQGFDLYQPVGEGGEIDLIGIKDGKISRIQCKSAKYNFGGTIRCRFYGVGSNGKQMFYTNIDLFAYWCPEQHQGYYIWNDQRTSETSMFLRMIPCRNLRSTDVNWAKDYLVA